MPLSCLWPMRCRWSVAEALSNVSNKLRIKLFFFSSLFKIWTISNVVCLVSSLSIFSYAIMSYVLMDFIELLLLLLHSLLYSKNKLFSLVV